MATKQEQKEALEALMRLKALITSPTSLLKVSIEYGRGVTDYLTTELYWVDIETGHIRRWNITRLVANACGMQLRQNGAQIAMGGGGYSKRLQVMSNLAHTLGITGDIQDDSVIRWER